MKTIEPIENQQNKMSISLTNRKAAPARRLRKVTSRLQEPEGSQLSYYSSSGQSDIKNQENPYSAQIVEEKVKREREASNSSQTKSVQLPYIDQKNVNPSFLRGNLANKPQVAQTKRDVSEERSRIEKIANDRYIRTRSTQKLMNAKSIYSKH